MSNNLKEIKIVNPIVDPTELDSNPELGQALSSLGKNASRSVELSTSPYIGGMQGAGESQYDVGLPKSLFSEEGSLAKTRGEAQPWYDQAASFLNQAVVGEIIGGTIMTAGAIVGIPELIKNVVEKGEFDFSNELFDVGKDISDWTRDVTPIYQTGERFGDSGWWWANGVSLASSASMLLPGMAVAKGVGLLGKAFKLGVTTTNMLSTGLGAVAMRHSENFREANDVFQQSYQIALNQGKSETEARKIASDAASLDYKANYANLVFDVLQLGSILKPFAGLTRNISPIAGKVAGAADEAIGVSKYAPKTFTAKIFDRVVNPAKSGLAEWTEGIEEGINSISSLEAIRQAKIQSGAIEDDGSTLLERVGNYLGEAEVQDAMLWGLIGGVAFKGLASAIGMDESKGIARNKITELAERKEIISEYSKILKNLQEGKGEFADPKKYTPEVRAEITSNVKDNLIQELTFKAAEAGNVDILLAQIQDGNFAEQLVQSGIGTAEEIKAQIPELVKKVEKYENIYAKTYAKFYDYQISPISKKLLMNEAMEIDNALTDNIDSQNEATRTFNELISKDSWYNTQQNKSDVDIALKSHGLLFGKLQLQKQLAKTNPKSDEYSTLEGAIAAMDAELKEIPKTQTTPDIRGIDRRILQANLDKITLEFYNKETAKNLEKLSNPDIVKEKAKNIDKIVKQNKKTVEDIIQQSSVKEATKEREAAAAKVNGESTSTDSKTEIVNEEDLNKDLSDSVGEMFGEEVIDELSKEKTSSTEPIEESPSNKIQNMSSEDISSNKELEVLNTPIEIKKADIERRRQEELNIQLERNKKAVERITVGNGKAVKVGQKFNESYHVIVENASIGNYNGEGEGYIVYSKIISDAEFDENGRMSKAPIVETEVFNNKEDADRTLKERQEKLEKRADTFRIDKINAKYDAELQALNIPIQVSEKEKDLSEVNKAITPEVSDGEAISIKEEELGDNDFESRKRIFGSAINYLVQNYSTTSGKMGKTTLDSSTANPIALSASEWQNFKPGEEVELSLDTGFSGEVDLYDARGKRIRNSDGTIAKQFKTFEQIVNEDPLDAPIKIEAVRNGQKVVVGYFPSIKWLAATDWTSAEGFENLANTEEVPASGEIDKVKAIRELISKAAADQIFKFKVDDTNLGNLNKDTEGKLAPLSKAMPNLTTSPYYKGRAVRPFVIFNKGFRISPDTVFEGDVALSEDYRKNVEAKGTGGLFMMVPSAKEGIFIPTPVTIPLVTPQTAKALATIISDYKLNTESANLKEAGKQTGINIKNNRALKEFLSNYVYISKQRPEGYNDNIPRIIFDTEKSEIILHQGRQDKKNTIIQLNNLDKLQSDVLESTLSALEYFIGRNKITVKHSMLNSSETLSIPENIDGKIQYKETTLENFLVENVQTNLRELVTENGTPVYATQPVIYISPKDVLDSVKDKVEAIVNERAPFKVGDAFTDSVLGMGDDLIVGNIEENFQSDELISDNKTIKPGVSELFDSNPELANEVYEDLGFKTKSEINTINESEITWTDEQGNPCAKMGGRSSKFTKGSQWGIVKDLKGYPSHAQGGVDVKIGKDGFSFTRDNGIIRAKYGLVLPKIK